MPKPLAWFNVFLSASGPDGYPTPASQNKDSACVSQKRPSIQTWIHLGSSWLKPWFPHLSLSLALSPSVLLITILKFPQEVSQISRRRHVTKMIRGGESVKRLTNQKCRVPVNTSGWPWCNKNSGPWAWGCWFFPPPPHPRHMAVGHKVQWPKKERGAQSDLIRSQAHRRILNREGTWSE